MTKSDDLQMQADPSSEPARKRIEEREDEFTHGFWNIVPSELNFNAHNADGLFSKDNRIYSKESVPVPALNCLNLMPNGVLTTHRNLETRE
jgi:hypothetical protein